MKIGIIGGNISGLSTSILLAERNINSTVFEPKLCWDKPCGGVIRAEYLKWLQNKGIYLKDKFCTRNYVFILNGKLYEKKVNRVIDVALNRLELQEALYKKALDSGIEVIQRKIIKDDIKSLCNEYDFLIVACGFNKLANDLLNRKYQSFERGACVFAEIPVKKQYDRLLFELNTNHIGYGWLFPKKNRINLGWGRELGNGVPLKYGLNKFIQKINNYSSLDISIAKINVRAGKLPLDVNTLNKPFYSYHHNTLFVGVGDSIGLVDPANGGGMCNAIKSAKFLVDAIKPPKFHLKRYRENIYLNFKNSWNIAKIYRKLFRITAHNQICGKIVGQVVANSGERIIDKVYSYF